MSGAPISPEERQRRWRLALGGDDAGGLGDRDQRLDRALAGLYDATGAGGQGKGGGGGRRGGLGSSAPTVARWLGDIREFFPSPVVQVIQKDAFERLGLKQMLLEPEFLAAAEADVHLIADLIALRAAMPDKTKDTARQVVAKVVKEVMEKLESRTVEAVRGALNKQRRTSRPRFSDIDWPRTIAKNLQHWQAEHRTIGLIVGSGVLITLLSTFDIWGSWHPVLRESAAITQLLRAIWVIAFLYDWATSLVAIIDLAGLADHSFNLLHMLTADRLALLRFIAAGMAALVVCGATVVVSFMAYNERREGAPEA